MSKAKQHEDRAKDYYMAWKPRTHQGVREETALTQVEGSFGEVSVQWRQESEPNQNNKGMARCGKMRISTNDQPTNSPGKTPAINQKQQQSHTLVIAHAPPHGDEPEV